MAVSAHRWNGHRILQGIPPEGPWYFDGAALAGDGPVAGFTVADASEPDRTAAVRVAAWAQAVVGTVLDTGDALPAIDPARIDVRGDGAVARLCRLALPTAAPDNRPQAVIDTTGDGDTIAAALRELDDLGVLVLAGGHRDQVVDIDLYPDVHVRGLSLIGVPVPVEPIDLPGAWAARVDSLLEWLQPVSTDEPLPHDAAWYVLQRP